MLVRSQCKKKLVNVGNGSFIIDSGNYDDHVLKVIIDGKMISLGEFINSDNAINVLDEIQQSLINKESIYLMPEHK